MELFRKFQFQLWPSSCTVPDTSSLLPTQPPWPAQTQMCTPSSSFNLSQAASNLPRQFWPPQECRWESVYNDVQIPEFCSNYSCSFYARGGVRWGFAVSLSEKTFMESSTRIEIPAVPHTEHRPTTYSICSVSYLLFRKILSSFSKLLCFNSQPCLPCLAVSHHMTHDTGYNSTMVWKRKKQIWVISTHAKDLE